MKTQSITDRLKLDERKERLAAITLGGQSTKYLGKNVSPKISIL